MNRAAGRVFRPYRQGRRFADRSVSEGFRRIHLPQNRRRPRRGRWINVLGAAANNLKSIDVRIPLGLFVCLTGVSGSGKSTLAEEILYRAASRFLGTAQARPGIHRSISGLENLTEVILVDQRPIGRTPRANALTYTKALDPIRHLLAAAPAAREKGFEPRHFSFNVEGGRCEVCKGDGYEKVEMQFLSDVFISCPQCNGRRFKPEVLAVTYGDRSIDDLLSMTVDAALQFFDRPSKRHAAIRKALQPLSDVGLGYIRLGQPINTFRAAKPSASSSPDTSNTMPVPGDCSSSTNRPRVCTSKTSPHCFRPSSVW